MTRKMSAPFWAIGFVVFMQIWLVLSTVLTRQLNTNSFSMCFALMLCYFLFLKMHYHSENPWGTFWDAFSWGTLVILLILAYAHGFVLWTPWVKLFVSAGMPGNQLNIVLGH